MKKVKLSTLILIGIPLWLILFFTFYWHEPKYGMGRDTEAYFGRDAEYHLIRNGIYTLIDQVNDKVVEPIVYRYYYKNKMAYVEGVTGFSIIDVKKLEVYHYDREAEMTQEALDIFENNNFKEVQNLRFNKFEFDKITTKDDGVIGNTEIYLGYNKNDLKTKEFLDNNYDLVVDEIKNCYRNRRFAEVTSINFHLEDILSDKLKIHIKDIQY